MSLLVWDTVGERRFETGVDKGVLYVPSGAHAYGVPWNGLTGIDETADDQVTTKYLDGVKYLEAKAPGDYSATLRAYTYPKEFEPFTGLAAADDGILVGNQPSGLFHLSYRTLIGNDVDGVTHGYRIHVLWNLVVESSDRSLNSVSDSLEASEFSWTIGAIPSVITGFKPTVHLVFDSTRIAPASLTAVEAALYGSNPSGVSDLPTMQALLTLAVTP